MKIEIYFHIKTLRVRIFPLWLHPSSPHVLSQIDSASATLGSEKRSKSRTRSASVFLDELIRSAFYVQIYFCYLLWWVRYLCWKTMILIDVWESVISESSQPWINKHLNSRKRDTKWPRDASQRPIRLSSATGMMSNSAPAHDYGLLNLVLGNLATSTCCSLFESKAYFGIFWSEHFW